MIQERDITVAKSSLLKEVEYDPWEYHGKDSHISVPACRSVSNMHYMCLIFQSAAGVLEEM